MKPVAVIILNWNGAGLLDKYLPSVIRHTPADIAEVIVADNGSTDSSIELLQSKYPAVRILPFDKNYGFAEGYNRAIAMTRAQYTVLLNSDVEVHDDWLTPLYRYMREHPECGAVQPKIRSLRHPDMFEYAGASGGFLDRDGYPYCRGRMLDTVEPDCGQYDDARNVMWASGAALMVDSDLYMRLGGLDPDFFAHMEEIDLCWRIQLAGRTVVVEPAATVYHLGGASLAMGNPRKTYLNFRNSLLMIHKCLPKAERKKFLLRRRLLDTLPFIKFMLTGQFGHAMSVLKAHRDFRHMRRTITMPDPAPEINLLKESPDGRRSLLWQYMVRHRHRYSELK